MRAFILALIMSATPALAGGHHRYVGELAARTCLIAMNEEMEFYSAFGQAYLDMARHYPSMMEEPTSSLRAEVHDETMLVCPDFFWSF